MKKIILAAALLSATALTAAAQTTAPATTAPATSTDGKTPAVATPDTKNPTAPVEGANSFTEEQAKTRIEEAGYSDVKDLKKDDKGIWMAAGMKDGKAVMIALDYQGNVVAK
ncbi:PepSY domain-containing protein [Agrobacterium rosae]|uniref:PepSY domain-containing protein n=1 Tax=Agrobacterium rosae TaxID=1972867 RepID=UPI003BA0CA04